MDINDPVYNQWRLQSDIHRIEAKESLKEKRKYVYKKISSDHAKRRYANDWKLFWDNGIDGKGFPAKRFKGPNVDEPDEKPQKSSLV